VLGGLPRPEAQTSLHDSKGRFLGRPDLYYPSHRLGLEYDGGTHRISLAEDNRRQIDCSLRGFGCFASQPATSSTIRTR
jgi:hypothetical protein